MKANSKPVWLITGCSTGLGRALAEHLVELGYPLVATARNPDQIQDLGAHENVLTLPMDVSVPSQVESAVNAAEKACGRIDVLVNNAGLGYFAAVEESEDSAIQRLFDINFFGVSRMIHAVLPRMRQRKSGSILNITSIGGLQGVVAAGYYCATKFAVEGLSDALAREVEPLGIKVMLVEPGAFRTEWSRTASESRITIPDYAATAGVGRERYVNSPGTQPGDPARAAQAIVQAAEAASPPRRLLLGKDAYEQAIQKLETMRSDFEAWKDVALGTDFLTAR